MSRDRIEIELNQTTSRGGLGSVRVVETELVLLLSSLAFFRAFFFQNFDILLANHYCFSIFTMAKRGETWTDDEVLALISIWSEEAILKMLETCHKNADIYEKMSAKLETLGIKRDLKQCRTKVKHLKTSYKKYKDSLARSGAARVKEPKFFEQLDIFLGDQPEAIGIDGAIDTLSTSLSAEKENTSDLGKYK